MNNKSDTHVLLLCSLLMLLPAASMSADEEKPSLAMLDFLADWDQDNNEWIDPLTVQEYAQIEKPQSESEDKRHD